MTQSTSISRLLQPEESMLLVVDIQEKLLAAMPDAEKFLAKTVALLEGAARLQLPVVVSEQYPKGLGHTEASVKGHFPANVNVLEKISFGCGQDAEILSYLQHLGRKQILLCGLETHICVNQTAHQLLQKGFQVHLMTDATRSRDKKDYKTALAKMDRSGVILSSVEMALFELLGSASHPEFKAVQALVKQENRRSSDPLK